MGRESLVSESWSQAAVIINDLKSGIMLDPTVVHENWDYREFGDMFFDLEKDPLEVETQINGDNYKEVINRLRSYYEEFVKNTTSTGKEEMIKNKMAQLIKNE